MENNPGGNHSDKDSSVNESAESHYSDEKGIEKSKNKKKKKSFPLATLIESKEAETKTEIEAKKPSTLESLFESTDESKSEKIKNNEVGDENLETLTNEEMQAAAIEYIGESSQDVQSELIQTDFNSEQEFAAAANLAFLNELRDRVEAGESVEAVIDESAEKSTLELKDEPIEEIVAPEGNEDEADNPQHLPNPKVAASKPSNTTPLMPLAPLMPVHSRGNLPPPTPASILNAAIPQSPNNPQTLTAPSLLTTNEARFDSRRRRKDLLIGGLVGYFIGRRRGRIKTEAKLLPVQHKLEKEVKELHLLIANKESEVRTRALKQFEATNTASKPVMRDQIEQLRSQPILEVVSVIKSFENTEVTPKPNTTKLVGREQIEHPQTPSPLLVELIPTVMPVEVAQVLTPSEMIKSSETEIILRVPEKIGKFIIAKSPEMEIQAEIVKKPVDQMTIPELLKMAETIKVEDVSLRTMYEQGTIDQNGLRRATKEYLRGGRVERLLPEITKGYEYKQQVQLERTPVETASATNSGGAGQSERRVTTDVSVARGADASRSDTLFDHIAKDSKKSENNTNTAVVVSGTVLVTIIILALLLLLR